MNKIMDHLDNERLLIRYKSNVRIYLVATIFFSLMSLICLILPYIVPKHSVPLIWVAGLDISIALYFAVKAGQAIKKWRNLDKKLDKQMWEDVDKKRANQ